MSRKPTLPGVDPEALAALARQYPPSSVGKSPQAPFAAVTMPSAEPAKEAPPPIAKAPEQDVKPVPPQPALAPAPVQPVADLTKATPVAAPTPPPAPTMMISEPKPAAAAKPDVKLTPPPLVAPAPPAGLAPAAIPGPTNDPKVPLGPAARGLMPGMTVDKPVSGLAIPNPPPAAAPAAKAVEKEPVAAAPVQAVVKVRGGGRGLAFLALLVAVVALLWTGSIAAPPELIDWVKRTVGDTADLGLLTGARDRMDARYAGDAAAIRALDGEVKAFAARIDAIEAVGGSSTAAATRVDMAESAINGLTDRATAHEDVVKTLLVQIQALEARNADLQSALTAAGDRAGMAENSIKENAARIAALDDANRRMLNDLGASVDALKKDDRRPERLLLAATHLRERSQGPAPFAKEVAAVSALAGDDAETQAALKVLGAHAGNGVPAISDLRASFAKLSPRIVALAPSNRASLTDRAVAWARSWVTTAREDAGDGRIVAAVTLAEASLANGQLAAAVDQLLLLEDRSALVASAWLREASARLAVDKAVATVAARAFERMASAK